MIKTIAVKREEALAYVAQHHLLCDVQRLERMQLLYIINTSLLYDGSTRKAKEYQRLKTYVSSVVGWDARQKELQTSGHYEVMLTFVDWLMALSEPKEVEEVDEWNIIESDLEEL